MELAWLRLFETENAFRRIQANRELILASCFVSSAVFAKLPLSCERVALQLSLHLKRAFVAAFFPTYRGS